MYGFIFLLGLVSFFADITYEGARSITGPFLALLGASGMVVGVTAGLGEFMGYAVRLLSGMITDKTRKYWLVTFIGYSSTLLIVPLLALAPNWEFAAVLIVLERVGKAIRTPARDAMLSYATKNIGRGFGFGIHEAMDRIGALIGPLAVYVILSYFFNYRLSFACLGIPAIFSLATLGIARKVNPEPLPQQEKSPSLSLRGFSGTFWLFLFAAGLIGAGYVDFALIAYHFQKKSTVTPAWIPLFYTFAMGSAAFFSLVGGKLFDYFSKPVITIATVLGALSVPFVFIGHFFGAFVGMLLWGIGLGMQGSILRSIVALLVPEERRSSAYGIFGVVFGLLWFLGSSLIGYLYDSSLPLAIAVSVALQLSAIPLLLKIEVKA